MLFKKEGIMMNENGDKTKEGYIYIYKCTQSTDKQDICKIGKTIHFKDELDRIKQHNRTPFHGFTPYIDFDTNQTIITVFKVNDATGADTVVKEAFNEFSMFETELYGVDYVDAIEKLYNLLKDNYYLLGIFRDGHTSVFKRLGVKYNSNLIIDGYGDYEDGTDKKDFQNLIKEIDNKYLGDYKTGFINGLCIDKAIYSEFEPYLKELVDEYLKDSKDKESLKYAAIFNVWESAFINMVNDKRYVIKKHQD